MAANIKYIFGFKDVFERNVTVSILTGESIAPRALETSGASPLSISFSGDESDQFKTMITSKVSISINLKEDDLDIYEDISNLTEDQYGVFIQVKDIDDTLVYSWSGWLIPDEQSKTFSYSNQTITLTAIDCISKLKGITLVDDSGAYVVGVKTLTYIVDRCIALAFDPNTSIGVFTLRVVSHVTLTNDTSDVLPPTFDQFSVSAESFNDDSGRPITCYEILEIIATAFNMKCFYENGRIHFLDYDTYVNDAGTTKNKMFYKQHPDYIENTSSVLLKNSEYITCSRAFVESRASITYKSSIGLLPNGTFTDWTPVTGGSVLASWDYNPSLLSQSDYKNRKRGNGRQESPNAIELRLNGSLTANVEAIASKYTRSIDGGYEQFSIASTVRMVNGTSIPDGETVSMRVSPVLYNAANPSQSYYIRAGIPADTPLWGIVDLTGTSFASGHFDFTFISGIGDWFGFYIGLVNTSNKQTASVDFPTLPIGFKGEMYVYISTPSSSTLSANPSLSATIIENILLTKIAGRNNEVKGEIVYITRLIKASEKFKLVEVNITTTDNDYISGAISSPIGYTRLSDSVFVPPGNVPYISVSGTSDYEKTPLISYIARVRMKYNYPQYKIDFEAKCKRFNYYDLIDFSVLFDIERPSTSIYNSPFIQTQTSFDFKTCQMKCTVISMKSVYRPVSKSTIDETHDLYEYYTTT